jgi:hypothetical protein
VLKLIASWGVDFIKVDDLSRPYHKAEIEAIRHAIDHAGRPIVFSTSPGATPLSEGDHISENANQWRVCDDFWDKWSVPHEAMHGLKEQFPVLAAWTKFGGPGHFPDADMLPLGTIDMGRRTTRFTHDEQVTLMTLWAIARSPLIMGGDLTKLDDFTLSLLTNDEVLAVDQNSHANHEVSHANDLIIWTADAPRAGVKYLALFNVSESATNITFDLRDLGFTNDCKIQSLWDGEILPAQDNTISPRISPHACKLYKIQKQ